MATHEDRMVVTSTLAMLLLYVCWMSIEFYAGLLKIECIGDFKGCFEPMKPMKPSDFGFPAGFDSFDFPPPKDQPAH